MKGLFDAVDARSQNVLSKADKKKFNAGLPDALDIKAECKIYHVNSKLKIIGDGTNFLYFQYYNRVYPTVRNFSKDRFKRVFLDEGAIGPIGRGASVMAPGILKYMEMSDRFSADEPVGVEIIDRGVFAVGRAMMGFDEMVRKKEGPVIEVFHFEGDDLHTGRFLQNH